MSILPPAVLRSVGSQSTFGSFLQMFDVAGRPERSALVVTVSLAFAAVPSVAKDVCCRALIEIPHLGSGGDLGLSSFSGHSGRSSLDCWLLLITQLI